MVRNEDMTVIVMILANALLVSSLISLFIPHVSLSVAVATLSIHSERAFISVPLSSCVCLIGVCGVCVSFTT